MNEYLQPYNQGNREFRGRRRRFPSFSGPQCPVCRSTDVRPFSAIYGFGTTTFFSRRGLIIPSHFERTRRQTVIAAQCAPPGKIPWWPAVLSLVVAGFCDISGHLFPRLAELFGPTAYWMLWAALALAVIAAVENFVFHPARMATWSRKLLCQKCGAAFEAQD